MFYLLVIVCFRCWCMYVYRCILYTIYVHSMYRNDNILHSVFVLNVDGLPIFDESVHIVYIPTLQSV